MNFLKNRRSIIIVSITSTVLMVITSWISYNRYLYFREIQRKHLQQAAFRAKISLESFLNYNVSKVKTLAFLTENYGIPENFDQLASKLITDSKCISAIEILEKGVIKKIYPYEGNEDAIGYDILRDSSRRKEALVAIKRKDVYFAGPIQLKQGGIGIVGRMPMFNSGQFIGFAAIVIGMDQLINCARLQNNQDEAFVYQLIKVNPTNGVKEYFLSPDTSFVGAGITTIDLPLGNWKLLVKPKEEITLTTISYTFGLGLILSLVTGFFIGYIAYVPSMLRKKIKLQTGLLRENELSLKKTIENLQNVNEDLKRMHWFQSHRIRAPIATLLGLTILLKDRLEDEENKEIANKILFCAEEFDRIIKDTNKPLDKIN